VQRTTVSPRQTDIGANIQKPVGRYWFCTRRSMDSARSLHVNCLTGYRYFFTDQIYV